MRKQDGFTLIELLIVLAILGILVGIVSMSVGNLTASARRRGIQSEYQVAQTSMDTYLTQDSTADPGYTIEDSADITTTDDAEDAYSLGPDGVKNASDTTFSTSDDDGYAFVKYLRRDSKYYYQWMNVGEGSSDEALVALDTADLASAKLAYDGAMTYERETAESASDEWTGTDDNTYVFITTTVAFSQTN